VLPFPSFSTAATDTSLRKTMPKPESPPVASFPPMQRATLSNGMKIILAERHSLPIVNLSLLFDAGYASDPPAAPGIASLAMNMLDEGTKTRTALQLSEALAQLGATLGTGASLDLSTISMSALKSNLDSSLNIFSDVILNPSFPKDDFTRLQRQTIASIQREKAQPFQMGLRVLPQFLYGKGHAYAAPLTGSGTEESVAKMTRDEMIGFHKTWIKPNNSTLIVVGDITLGELQPKLEKLFAAWTPGEVPKKNIGTVEQPAKSSVYIMDKPGADQSVVFAGQLAPQKNSPDDIAFEAMNTILGGAFTSRINMNIRENKHWSYGARTAYAGARGQRPYLAYAPVQFDKTKETMVELKKEFTDIEGTRPATQDELLKVQNSLTLQLPGRWETIDAVISSIVNLVNYRLPDDYYATYPQKVKELTLADITNVANRDLRPESLIWVIVGDRQRIEAGVRSLGYGELHFLDASGNVIP